MGLKVLNGSSKANYTRPKTVPQRGRQPTPSPSAGSWGRSPRASIQEHPKLCYTPKVERAGAPQRRTGLHKAASTAHPLIPRGNTYPTKGPPGSTTERSGCSGFSVLYTPA